MRNYFLETERIGFSTWDMNDYDLALSLWGDAAVTQHISKTGIFTPQDIMNRLKKEIENQQQFKVQYWPIFEKNTGDFIGCCGLRPYDIENKIYEIGFHLRSSHWGKGLGPEAAKAVIRYALFDLDANGLFAGHNPNNTNSRKVLEKLGFTYVGDEFYEPTGLYHPSYKFMFNIDGGNT